MKNLIKIKLYSKPEVHICSYLDELLNMEASLKIYEIFPIPYSSEFFKQFEFKILKVFYNSLDFKFLLSFLSV